MAFHNSLPKKSENLSDWYNAVILQTELAEYGPAKGTMIFRPYGYAIWEEIQKNLDLRFKAYGVENAYFPLFIPESLINKEKHHLEGFSPELAVVTIGGGEELSEKLIVRPTSETIIGSSLSKWIKSWRDLPVLLNQWSSAVRWEKRTYLFMRSTEFLWQEGHTAHATHEDAIATQNWAMDTYKEMFEKFFALPGYIGKKSPSETFAGANNSITYETLMPEGKVLQSCTSHDLGQNFAEAFDIGFQNKNEKRELVWQTSWGLSTRSMGALILAHGDDKGLRLPPKLAPIQVIVIPVKIEDDLLNASKALVEKLAALNIRAKVDIREETIGFKINKWEVKGVPFRIEVGKRELESGVLKGVRRDTGEEIAIDLEMSGEKIKEILESIQDKMLEEARNFLRDNTHEVSDYKEFQEIMRTKKGFIKAFWCGDSKCESSIKEETTASTRCKSDSQGEEGLCIYCNNPANEEWYFAQSY